jgi:dCTP deaminase
MILSDQQIKQEIETGNIKLEPYIPEHQNPNSVDLTLNKQLKVYKAASKWRKVTQKTAGKSPVIQPGMFVDPRAKNEVEEAEIPEEGLILKPGQLYLFTTNETLGSNKYASKVEGKSSIGRLGLFIHVTAGWIDTGFFGQITLEMVATIPIRVYPNMKICQVAFYVVQGGVDKLYGAEGLGSKYQNQTGVQESKYHDNYISNEEFVASINREGTLKEHVKRLNAKDKQKEIIQDEQAIASSTASPEKTGIESDKTPPLVEQACGEEMSAKIVWFEKIKAKQLPKDKIRVRRGLIWEIGESGANAGLPLGKFVDKNGRTLIDFNPESFPEPMKTEMPKIVKDKVREYPGGKMIASGKSGGQSLRHNFDNLVTDRIVPDYCQNKKICEQMDNCDCKDKNKPCICPEGHPCKRNCSVHLEQDFNQWTEHLKQTAAKVYGIPVDELDKNLGTNYKIGGKVVESIDCTHLTALKKDMNQTFSLESVRNGAVGIVSENSEQHEYLQQILKYAFPDAIIPPRIYEGQIYKVCAGAEHIWQSYSKQQVQHLIDREALTIVNPFQIIINQEKEEINRLNRLVDRLNQEIDTVGKEVDRYKLEVKDLKEKILPKSGVKELTFKVNKDREPGATANIQVKRFCPVLQQHHSNDIGDVQPFQELPKELGVKTDEIPANKLFSDREIQIAQDAVNDRNQQLDIYKATKHAYCLFKDGVIYVSAKGAEIVWRAWVDYQKDTKAISIAQNLDQYYETYGYLLENTQFQQVYIHNYLPGGFALNDHKVN